MAAVGSDDYALTRVPRSERYGFVSVLLQWVGNSGSLSQFDGHTEMEPPDSTSNR